MCEWGTREAITIEQHITVDACLAELIVYLNASGVHTTGCCCGHGKVPGFVTIKPSAVTRAKSLGLTVRLRGELDPEIELLSLIALQPAPLARPHGVGGQP